ncbi:uncharacterized protein J8A68_005740 [[Candida] subhashii]|uniref:F-box domain-containing protein n=1 Tax=[Candida] subhashii TaxID=561895 RepID=A0A8J5QDP2_9ASCO|nr:uncharacterized protein J8A68_005740 [[Candida] subhashii]KAG7660778.1 hypothetical protein J8A68_005740 [[Candida] subhashii]
MGFVNPGKSLKKRKLRKSISLTTSLSTCDNNDFFKHKKPQHSSITLDSLPPSIIKQIFIFVGPHNNLPLVNKRVNQILKFNPNLQIETGAPWENFSLVKSMIDRYYLCDMNERVDFALVEDMIEYYFSRLGEITQKFGSECRQCELLGPIAINIGMIDNIVEVYKSEKFALLGTSVHNRFATIAVINKFARERCGESISFRTTEEIEFHKKRRLQILRFKFDELRYYLNRARAELEAGQFDPCPDVREENYIQNILDSRSQASPFEGSEGIPQLPVYDDEDLRIEGFHDADFPKSLQVYLEYMDVNYQFPTPSDSDFVWTVPASLVSRDLEFAFSRIPHEKVRHIDPLVSALLKWFHPEVIRSHHPSKSFEDYISLLLENTVCSDTHEDAVYECFELYDIYSKQASPTPESKHRVEHMLEDLKRGALLLIQASGESFDSDQIWKYLRELGNKDLMHEILASDVPLPSPGIDWNF